MKLNTPHAQKKRMRLNKLEYDGDRNPVNVNKKHKGRKKWRQPHSSHNMGTSKNKSSQQSNNIEPTAATNNNSNVQNTRGRGMSRGGFNRFGSFRGRGAQRGGSNGNDKSGVTCFNCGRTGHYANECFKPKNNNTSSHTVRGGMAHNHVSSGRGGFSYRGSGRLAATDPSVTKNEHQQDNEAHIHTYTTVERTFSPDLFVVETPYMRREMFITSSMFSGTQHVLNDTGASFSAISLELVKKNRIFIHRIGDGC